jgi:hypothetical protein
LTLSSPFPQNEHRHGWRLLPGAASFRLNIDQRQDILTTSVASSCLDNRKSCQRDARGRRDVDGQANESPLSISENRLRRHMHELDARIFDQEACWA